MREELARVPAPLAHSVAVSRCYRACEGAGSRRLWINRWIDAVSIVKDILFYQQIFDEEGVIIIVAVP
jgi:hypothetical protein